MKVTFYSNYLNHHQLPFCKEMYRKLGNNFKFVAHMPVLSSRLKLGYEDMNNKYPFVIRAYESDLNKAIAMKLCIDSDVIITGSAPEIYTKTRLKENKLVFRYSERVYKKGIWRVFSPKGLSKMLELHTRHREKKIYMLCASAYTAGDFGMIGAYKNKTYKWGYFPECIDHNIESLIKDKPTEKIDILWCGRFLDWKHPEKAIHLASKLKSNGYKFNLNMIGTGELEKEIKYLIKKLNLNDCVNLLGSMSYKDVREHMEKSNIFISTSDYNEGWGAVLNEAMNSGCAVVASHAIGAAPFLIKNYKNGIIYKNNKYNDLFNKVTMLINNQRLREDISRNAYYTIKDRWNGKIAANRFIDLSTQLMNGDNCDFKDGPCSKAKRIYQWNMFKYCNKKY